VLRCRLKTNGGAKWACKPTCRPVHCYTIYRDRGDRPSGRPVLEAGRTAKQGVETRGGPLTNVSRREERRVTPFNHKGMQSDRRVPWWHDIVSQARHTDIRRRLHARRGCTSSRGIGSVSYGVQARSSFEERTNAAWRAKVGTRPRGLQEQLCRQVHPTNTASNSATPPHQACPRLFSATESAGPLLNSISFSSRSGSRVMRLDVPTVYVHDGYRQSPTTRLITGRRVMSAYLPR